MAEIPLSQLEQMFENMRTEAGWDTDQELLWGYFFTDPKPESLRPLRMKLEAIGYRFVNLYPTDDRSTHFLHVERVEVHSPRSLARRNQELNALADKFGVESYDGMDVGPVSTGEH
jgi:hypothetical protein